MLTLGRFCITVRCFLFVPAQLLQQLMMNNPSGAVSLAKMVAKQTPPPVDINTMADLFLQVGFCTKLVHAFARSIACHALCQHCLQCARGASSCVPLRVPQELPGCVQPASTCTVPCVDKGWPCTALYMPAAQHGA